ncbi:MAG TPA: phosphatase PAP2 family protein [Streptosporangiaceae bacterium]|nr:phosphatase PAP2 family protein [Streptosporangiaceae bacterium]
MSASVTAAPAAALALEAPRALSARASAAPVPRTSGAHGLDKRLFLDVNSFARHTGWLHAPMLAYAVEGGIILLALLLVVGWWLARRRRDAPAMAAALWAGIATIAAVGIVQPVNHAVAEARPWEGLPHALILAGHSTDFSFPSDHAVMAGAVTAGLFLYHRRLGVIAAIAAVLLCFGRVYIGAHYPQDVAAGLIIGAVVVLIGYVIVHVPLAALVRLASRTPLRILVTARPGLLEPAGARRAREGQPADAPSAGSAPIR